MNLKNVVVIGVLFLISTIFFSSCSWQKLRFYEPDDILPIDQNLKRCVERWTRHLQKHERWSTVLDVDAIFLSWDVRKLILERKIADHINDPEVADAMRDREQQIFNAYVEFYLAVMTTQDDWNNFTDDDPVWSVVFVSDDGFTIPAYRIEEVELDPALAFTYFPKISKWKKLYKVSFVRNQENRELPIIHRQTNAFSLLFKGYFGQATLTWKLS